MRRICSNFSAGIPQSVHNGAAFVGSSAWYLFPDMCRGQGCKGIVPGAMLIEVGRILTTGFGSTADFEAIVRRSLRLAEATAL